MRTTGDTNDDAVARPQPFVVSHPCPECEAGVVDGQACAECWGTGVGRFYHGTKASLTPGDLLAPGNRANFGDRDRTTTYIYLTGTLDAATWGAELAIGEGPGRIYIVEPTGPIEDDPNLTDMKYPGNPTRSFRSVKPLLVIGEVTNWLGHSPEQLKVMKENVERARRQGIEPID
jgi:rifampin ADP-ribosylating transferase